MKLFTSALLVSVLVSIVSMAAAATETATAAPVVATTSEDAVAPAAAPAPVVAEEVKPEVSAYQAYVLQRPSLLLASSEAGDALQTFQLKLDKFEKAELRYALTKLEAKLTTVEGRLARTEQRLDAIEESTKYSFIAVSTGYKIPTGGDAVGTPYAKVVFEKILSLYGEVNGKGFGLGFNAIVSPRLGRVTLDVLGMGVQVYADSKDPLNLRKDERAVDLAVKPLEVSAKLYNTKWISFGLVGAVSMNIAGPTVWYNRAEKAIGSIENKTTTPSLNGISTDPNAIKDQLSGLAPSNQVDAQADEVKDKTEEAGNQAWSAIKEGFNHPYVSIGFIGRF